MKIAIVGAGALGCAIGGALAQAGNAVVLINRNAAHVQAIKQYGLRIFDGNCGEQVVPVAATLRAQELEPAQQQMDIVIVLVKSRHTREAMQAATCLVGRHTVVLSLQNGLGHEEILMDVVGKDHVLAGKTYVGGVLRAPGSIISAVQGKETIIGELDGRISTRAQAIADVFCRAGLHTQVSERMMSVMWDKLLINVATGAVSAITGLAYGALYRLPEIEATAVAAVQEAMDVAAACGIALDCSEARAAWIKAGQGLPENFKTSMLQSMEKNAPTEIDFINGAVVRHGQRCGVATPVNQTLVALVKGLEVKARESRQQQEQPA